MDDQLIEVLLVEQEPDTISLITLSLSEIKECRLEVCSSGDEAVLRIPELKPDLILLAHGLQGKDTFEVVAETLHKNPSIIFIISLSPAQANLSDRLLVAGVKECVVEDKNYVGNLVAAVKRSLIAIAERVSFDLPQMTRADQLVMDENLPDVVFSLDLESKILYANRAISPILGYEQNEIIGMPFAELIGEEESKRDFASYIDQLESQIQYRKVLPLKNSLGLTEDFDVNLTLMEGETIYGVAKKQPAEPEGLAAFEAVEESSGVEVSSEDLIPAYLGPYRVVTLLGAGSMGRVYKGIDEQLDRPVAIKVLNRALASDFEHLERFRQEAKILASITHPNIALIFHFGNYEEIPFFCMEYLPGGSLETMMEQKGILDTETAIAYTMQAALGLGEALEKGVIHLDIKPSNLMIAEKDRLKIVDFGLARTKLQQKEVSGSVVGTPLYIAPEQIQGGVVDFRCDIFSLGMTFFEMLYGFVPHAASTLPEIFKKRLYENLPARENLTPEVPLPIYNVLLRMTDRDPAKRYSGYGDLITDLENARRSAFQQETVTEIKPPEATVRMQGALYDTPFAEILGVVTQRQASGKLTLSWIDLYKNLHFKNGKITAVLSNQEGESFLDLFLIQKLLTSKQARTIQSGSTNLFIRYSTAMSEIPPQMQEALNQDMQLLAWKILEGLFSWVVGEFILEDGEFPDQILPLDLLRVLRRGVMEWMDLGTIQRKLKDGNCKIATLQDFQKMVRQIDIPAEQQLIAFRIGEGILFQDLLSVSGMNEKEFFRLMYLFRCLGVISISELRPEDLRPAPPVEPKPAAVEATVKRVEPAPGVSAEKSEMRRSPQPPSAAGQKDLAQYYFLCAVKSFSSKNYWAAVEYCKKALEYKKESNMYQLMGKALATHPSFKHEAMEALKKAEDLDPFNISVQRDVADLYFSTGNMALAKAKYEAFLKVSPGDEAAKKRLQEIKKKKKEKH